MTTRDDIHKMVRAYDPELLPGQPGFHAAMLILSACILGTDVDVLTEFTGIRKDLALEMVANLKRAEIWREDGLNDTELMCDRTSGTALSVFILIALGEMTRRWAPELHTYQ